MTNRYINVANSTFVGGGKYLNLKEHDLGNYSK